jgi:hypothetical protein
MVVGAKGLEISTNKKNLQFHHRRIALGARQLHLKLRNHLNMDGMTETDSALWNPVSITLHGVCQCTISLVHSAGYMEISCENNMHEGMVW